jgi:hypothetical protein
LDRSKATWTMESQSKKCCLRRKTEMEPAMATPSQVLEAAAMIWNLRLGSLKPMGLADVKALLHVLWIWFSGI